MSYTIVRPGGMERPKDDYKESHNLVIKPRDSIFGGQVKQYEAITVPALCLAVGDAALDVCGILCHQPLAPAGCCCESILWSWRLCCVSTQTFYTGSQCLPMCVITLGKQTVLKLSYAACLHRVCACVQVSRLQVAELVTAVCCHRQQVIDN
jgi:hypothetical protein